MKTTETKVNDLLKMRTPQDVCNDIHQLEAVKKSLIHFIASYGATEHPECKEVAEHNLLSVKTNLRALYAEIEQIKVAIKEVTDTSFKTIDYQYSTTEKKAISLFNNNKSFSITE